MSMWYSLYKNDGTLVHVTRVCPYTGTPELKKFIRRGVELSYDTVVDQREWSNEHAAAAAAYLDWYFVGIPNVKFIVTEDEGRYGVVKVPQVGDKVSKYFNGDSYPCGEVVKVTKTLQVKTSDGTIFRRVKNTGCWKSNCWSLQQGHKYEQNPHF